MNTPSSTTLRETDLESRAGNGEALIRRIRIIAGLSVSALLFWYFGWWVVGPRDPNGPVTLLTIDNGVIAMAEMLGLAVAASGLCVAIAGPRCGHLGPLAIAVGLAVVGLRGGQLDTLIVDRISSGVAQEDIFPTTDLIAETLLWLAVIAVGLVVGRWVESWFGAQSAQAQRSRGPVDSASEIRQGLGATIVIALLAYNVVRYIGGQENEGVLKGQVYFALGAGFLASTVLAQWIFRATSRIWCLVAIVLVTMACYSINGPEESRELAAAAREMVYVNLKPAARPLPIEFASMGAVGALLGFSFGYRFQPDPDGMPE
ncbi:MAG: hypothetical protein O7F76_09765 [Planctomycetota bacterium]|nr:hypothetical protein [Planctomycetota bacterium]